MTFHSSLALVDLLLIFVKLVVIAFLLEYGAGFFLASLQVLELVNLFVGLV